MIFNDKELQNLNLFVDKHNKCYSTNNPNKENAGYSIRTGTTGIGFQTFIKCNCCGTEEDVTDYECW